MDMDHLFLVVIGQLILLYIYAIMKTMCPPSYYHNRFVASHALGHMIDQLYRLLVPMNQIMLNKLSKEHNISGHKWSLTHRVLKSHRSKMSVIYMQSWKECALPVITTWALWQLMHLDTWYTITHSWYQWTNECSTLCHIGC